MEGFGTLVLRSGVLRGIQTTWKEAICTRLEETVTYLVEHQLLTVKEGRDVSDAFGRHERLLDIEDGVILHGDYHNANIMIDEIGRKVVAAIDLSQAKSGDPIFDLAFYGTYVSDEIFDSFCGGYFGCSRRPSDFDKKLALYQLRIYLSKAKLRKRFGYNERIGSAIKGVLESLKKLT
jgi:aminoglycoside phosphotransferase (APT) family kinase protein